LATAFPDPDKRIQPLPISVPKRAALVPIISVSPMMALSGVRTA
jgi:hypothetical protein